VSVLGHRACETIIPLVPIIGELTVLVASQDLGPRNRPRCREIVNYEPPAVVTFKGTGSLGLVMKDF